MTMAERGWGQLPDGTWHLPPCLDRQDYARGECRCLLILHLSDQAQAEERELAKDRRETFLARAAWCLVGLYVAAGLYALCAALGWLPAAPWAPLGAQ